MITTTMTTITSSAKSPSKGRGDVHHKTLSTYYSQITPLGVYLQHYTGSDSLCLYSDPQEYKAILSGVLVATGNVRDFRENHTWVDKNELGRTYGTQQEAIDLILLELGNRGKPNVLTAAVSKTNYQSPLNLARPTTNSSILTTPSAALKSIPWRLLRSRLGDIMFRRLFLTTSLFVPLGNNCFIQLAGYPIYELYSHDKHGSSNKRKIDDPSNDFKITKKQKRPLREVGAADRLIGRSRMFYGRPPRFNNTFCFGLPHRHPLNRLNTSPITDDACHEMVRVMFPTLPTFKDIMKSNPRRLKKMTEAARQMLIQHSKIRYDALLRKCEDRMKQADLYDHPDALRSISHSQVCRYVTHVLGKIFGAELVGEENTRVIAAHARSVIRAKMYEPVNLHTLMQGIRINDFQWLALDDVRVNAAESKKRRELVERFIFWLFDDFLISLLRTSFYITETADTQYGTVYYTHSAWGRATGPHFHQLKKNLLMKLNPNEQYQAGSLGVSAVRLIPKRTGFRPIVNLGRQAKGKNSLGVSVSAPKSSVNQLLKPVHQVLTYEKNRQRHLLGSSLFGTNEIFAPIQALKKDLLERHGRIPRLYFVKMDIKSAFDTIKQDKMLQVIDRLLAQEEDYCLMTYALLLPPASKASQGSSRRLFKTKALIDGTMSSFDEHAKDIAEPLRNAVIVDLLRRRQVSRNECMDLLRNHISNNIWQIGSELFRQKTGIPQGSTISSLLCSILYAVLEEEHLGFVHKPGSRLLRYIDDFMLITDDYSLARRFVKRMHEGFPEYGAFVSPAKTLLSFEHTYGNQVAPVSGVGPGNESCFPFCGFLVDTRSLDLGIDVTRILGSPTSQSFALRSSRRKGSAFVGWFSRQLENRNHVGYLDTAHNSVETVYHNIFINMALSSMKVPHYFARRGLNQYQSNQVFKSLCLSAEYTYVAGRARVKHAARSDKETEHFEISRRDFIFLALSAMEKVFSRKVSRFKPIVRLLRDKLETYSEISKTMRMAVERGWRVVKEVKY